MSKEQKNNQKVEFVKMSGAGNDFIIIDNRHKNISLTKEQITKLSDRHVIGCDQLILINESKSLEVDCYIKIYNSDGSLSGACGNATRCVASILIGETNKQKVFIQTDTSILECWRQTGTNLVSVDMGIPQFLSSSIPTTKENIENGFYFSEEELSKYKFYLANIGNPHCVTFLSESIDDANFAYLGPRIENHPIFPEKINVEFAKITPKEHNSSNTTLIEVRVFERGAGETLACGSGACAVGAIAIKNNLINDNEVTIRFKGGDINIKYIDTKSSIIMSGDCKLIFSGSFNKTSF